MKRTLALLISAILITASLAFAGSESKPEALSYTSTGTTFACLSAGCTTTPPQSSGTLTYCSDCTQTTACAAGGTGAFATRQAGSWGCNLNGVTQSGVSGVFTNLTAGPGAISITGNTSSSQIGGVSVNGMVNVVAYGADPTGVASSTAAFNAARTAAGNGNGAVYVPYGKYLIDGYGLNMTALNGGMLTCAKGITYGTNARLIADTGVYPVIDETGSNGVVIQDCTIDGLTDSPASASAIGILQARTSAAFGGIAQQNVLRDVNVTLPSSATANNNVGTVAVYNYGAEITDYDAVYLVADVGLFLTATNSAAAVASHYQTIVSGTQSMSQVMVQGESTLVGNAGPVFECEGLCANVDLTNTYMNDSNSITYDFCVKGGQLQRSRWRGRCENDRRLLELTSGGALNSSDWNVLIAATGSSSSTGPIQLDTGAGTCPTISYSSLQVQDLTQTSGSLISESGSGCTGAELTDSIIDFIQGGGITLAQGSADNVRFVGNIGPGTVSLPGGSTIAFPGGSAPDCMGSAASIVAATTDWLACGENAAQSAITSFANAAVLLPRACVIRGLKISQTTAANTNTPVYTIAHGAPGSPTLSSVTCTVANTATSCGDASDVLVTTAFDDIGISAVNPTSASSTGVIYFAFNENCL